MAKKCKSCELLRKELGEVRDELAFIKFELAQIKELKFKRKNKKETDQVSKPEPKPQGAKIRHIGWFRKKSAPDKIVEVTAKICPHCQGHALKDCSKIEEHTQDDIVLPKLETTLFKKHTYYCKTCQKTFTARAENELTNSRIGPNAKSLAVFLKYAVRTSDINIKELFSKVFGLTIVTSSIPGFRLQLQKEALPIYERLKASIKFGEFIHADETGWSVNGLAYWLWKFCNKKISLSCIRQGRGQNEVAEILGDEYDGVLISDFLSAYNKIKCKKQRCLVHILRDLDKVIKYWDGRQDDQVLIYSKNLKELFRSAIKLCKEYKNKDWDKTYEVRRTEIIDQLKDFSYPDPNKRLLKRFSKRLNRSKDELFTFLFIPEIDFHNNHAEQQIRTNVIIRKITNGNRSEKGARVYETLTSILQTAKLNNINALDLLTNIFTKKLNPQFEMILSPP